MAKKRGSYRRDHLADGVYAQVTADIFEFRLLPGARFSKNKVASRAPVARATKLLRAHIETSKAMVQTISLHRLHLAHLDAQTSRAAALRPPPQQKPQTF